MTRKSTSGDRIEIRFAEPEDADQLLELKLALDDETDFMMLEPGERSSNAEVVRREIQERGESSNSALIVAAGQSLLAGYVEAYGGEFNRTRHLAMVVAGVRASHAGHGIGSRLFQALTDWADGAGLIRLELTVMVHNRPAIGLYRKYGFVEEGLRRCSVRVDGSCVDELAMARLGQGFAGHDGNE